MQDNSSANTITLATNLGRGGVCAIILSGSRELLARADYALKQIRSRGFPLQTGELIYGRVESTATGSLIDEVVIAAVSVHCRIISGHGGTACTLALLEFYREFGFSETASFPQTTTEQLLQNLLQNARTDLQACRVLEAVNLHRQNIPVDISSLQSLLRPRTVVLAGAPNAGKSSLLNRLCGYERVLVSAIAGTTRDSVKDYIDISGYFTHLIDTAGFRGEAGTAEKAAIRKSEEIIRTADLILLLIDNSRPLSADDELVCQALSKIERNRIITVCNKKDLPARADLTMLKEKYDLEANLHISCTADQSLYNVVEKITACFNAGSDSLS